MKFRIILVVVIVLSFSFTTDVHRAFADCASPMPPGHWGGVFVVDRKASKTVNGVDVRAEGAMSGEPSLDIACDGTISGVLNNVKIVIAEKVGGAAIGASPLEGDCTIHATLNVLSAKVQRGNQGLPLVSFDQVGATPIQPICTADPIGQLISNILNPNGPRPKSDLVFPTAFKWQASFAQSDKVTGDQPWQSVAAQYVFDQLLKGGANPEETFSWELNLVTGKNPPPNPTVNKKGDDTPVVTGLTGKFEQFFLEKIPVVINEYTVPIDWKGNTPGEVDFHAGNVTVKASIQGETASAPMQIDTLPAGKNPLNVTAFATNGKTSAVFTQPIIIVPVPAWAKPFNLEAKSQDTWVLYSSTHPKTIPDTPASANVNIPSFVPVVGGTWGLLPTQFQVNLSASSAGGLSNNQDLKGMGGFAIGGKQFPLMVRSDSFTRTNLTEDELKFDDGSVNMELATPIALSKELTPLQAIPGISVLEQLPVIGNAIRQFKVSLVTAGIQATFSGQGKLGIVKDELSFTGGTAHSDLDLQVQAGPNFFNTVFARLVGSAKGSLTFALAPKLALQDCSLGASFFVLYGAFGFGGSFPDPPSETKLASCADFTYRGNGSLLASPLLQHASPMHLIARSASWQPERSIDNPPPALSSTGVRATTLSENANALLANPAVAFANDGKIAVAWMSEDALQPRPQAFQIRVRLFDGTTWRAPVAVSSSAQPGYTPAVAYDGTGDIVVTWVRNNVVLLAPDAVLDESFLKPMEIAYAVLDSNGAVKTSGTLTNDQLMDFAPQLVTGRDGVVWLAWETSPAVRFIADAASPNLMHAARWSNGAWSPVETIGDAFIGTTQWQLTARDMNNALVVADAEVNGQKQINVFARDANSWKNIRTLNGFGGAVNPRVAFLADGRPVILWSDGKQLTGWLGDLNASPTPTLTTEGELSGALIDDAGGLAVVLTGTSSDRKTGIWLVRFDVQQGKWGDPGPLIETPNLPLSTSAAMNGRGDVVISLAQPGATNAAVKTASIPELGTLEIVQAPNSTPPAAAAPAPTAAPINCLPAALALVSMVLAGRRLRLQSARGVSSNVRHSQ